MKVWHLELLTWKGIVGNASHYMANLVDSTGERHEIDRPMTLNDALALGFTDREDIADMIEFGRETRFYSERAARNAAIDAFREKAEPDDVLLRGSWASHSPQEPLVGPEPLMSTLNELYERYEDFSGYDGAYRYDDNVRRTIDKIVNDWMILLEG